MHRLAMITVSGNMWLLSFNVFTGRDQATEYYEISDG